MDQEPSFPALPDRMKLLREQGKQFGGIAFVPIEVLDQIGYVRYEDEAGVETLVPVEKLAGDSLQAYVARKKQETSLPPDTEPFSTASFEMRVVTEFVSSVSSLDARTRLTRLSNKLSSNFEDHIPAFGPANDLINKAGEYTYKVADPSASELKHYQGNRAEIFRPDFRLSSFIADGFMASADAWGIAYLIPNDVSVISKATAESTWLHLEKLKSKIGDIDELHKEFEDCFGMFLGSDVEPEYEDTAPLTYDDVLPVAATYVGGARDAYLRPFSDILTADGFSDVAAELGTTTNTAEIRAIISKSLKTCALVQSFKDREKDLKRARSAMTDEANIQQFAAALSALRDEQKQSMKTLYAFRDVFDIPTIFARAVKSEIEAAQSMFIHTVKAGTLTNKTIRLDGRYDAAKDANPGKMSGDCTDGKPLPFGQNVGTHNIKVDIGDDYIGNIYLLKTTTKTTDEPVWHLDAVQVPSVAINWDDFPQQLINTLAPLAEAAGVKHITINSISHHISNYDYVANSFLKYAGASNTELVFDNEVGLQEDDVYEYEGDFPQTNLTFPKVPNFATFQGDDEKQIIIWSAPNKPIS